MKMSLANQDRVCVTPYPPPPPPNPLSPNSHKYTHCPANGRVNEDAFAFQCSAKVPTHSSTASMAGEKAPFTCFVSKLVTDLLLPPPSLFLCSNYKPTGTGRVCMGK